MLEFVCMHVFIDRCKSGWAGYNCDQCIKNSSCGTYDVSISFTLNSIYSSCLVVNGYCINADDCICFTVWAGPLCDIGINSYGTLSCVRSCEVPLYVADLNQCRSSPCKNGGTCVNSPGSYICQCKPGYLGTNCETGGSVFLFE